MLFSLFHRRKWENALLLYFCKMLFKLSTTCFFIISTRIDAEILCDFFSVAVPNIRRCTVQYSSSYVRRFIWSRSKKTLFCFSLICWRSFLPQILSQVCIWYDFKTFSSVTDRGVYSVHCISSTIYVQLLSIRKLYVLTFHFLSAKYILNNLVIPSHPFVI